MSDLPRLPFAFSRGQGVLLGGVDDQGVELLLRPGASPAAVAEVRRQVGRPLRLVEVDAETFGRQLAERYGNGETSAAEVADDISQEMDLSRLAEEIAPVEDLLEQADDAPVIRMINALLTQAVREGASDVHLEPEETDSVVRLRRDGLLYEILRGKRAHHAAMVSRVKILANLDIAEKRLPQDGRIGIRLAGRQVDVRVSTLPTCHGERAVLRLLEKGSERLDLTRLGMSAPILAGVDRLIRLPHGILLVTGPTGSGKTTTLYSAMARLDRRACNIMTVEDPVEYELSGVGQCQVNSRIELDFARALRAILRQDPDVVMIGEIRDRETAQIAVQASLTGHLVLATLHTNDAASAVSRLTDMGVEPYLLASSLAGILAQRLLRRLCPACRQAYEPDAAERRLLGPQAPGRLFRAQGCPQCRQTGYQGRTGIFELLEIDSRLRSLIHDRSSEASLRAAAQAGGMQLLRDDALRWLLAGETSLEEVLRVTRD
ncbi:MAG TPA: type II secretion system ATPase GspE [Rhodocyclaceae bacterium]|nr:type II secretion system ATPase GspE [Rhodocyclaceae bacterium]